jgi:serine/threonine protein kinase
MHGMQPITYVTGLWPWLPSKPAHSLLLAYCFREYRLAVKVSSCNNLPPLFMYVWRMCRLDGRKYAVKKIRLQPGGSSSSYSRILREVATLSRLQHPNVVRYYQVSSRDTSCSTQCWELTVMVRDWSGQ